MKLGKMLLFALIVGIVLIAGCSGNTYSAPRPPSGPVGGGCGVGAPVNTDMPVVPSAEPLSA